MNKTIVITSIYQEFWGTKQFRKSCEQVGLPLYNAFRGNRFTGNGDVIRMIYEALQALENKYTYAIYADGADSYFTKSFAPLDSCIIYSTEKAVWPPTTQMNKAWEDYYKIKYLPNINLFKNSLSGIYSSSPWKYLNGGGYCGPITLLLQFFERYGLDKLKGDVNGQDVQALAFIKAHDEGFPIFLDTECRYFQTIGFEDPGDFTTILRSDIEPIIKNEKTGNYPSLFHGNGRTPLNWIYDLFK